MHIYIFECVRIHRFMLVNDTLHIFKFLIYFDGNSEVALLETSS